MLQFKDVPYRRFRVFRGKKALVETGAYQRVMRLVAKAIAKGKSVTFDHRICDHDQRYYVPDHGRVYDTISVTIQD